MIDNNELWHTLSSKQLKHRYIDIDHKVNYVQAFIPKYKVPDITHTIITGTLVIELIGSYKKCLSYAADTDIIIIIISHDNIIKGNIELPCKALVLYQTIDLQYHIIKTVDNIIIHNLICHENIDIPIPIPISISISISEPDNINIIPVIIINVNTKTSDTKEFKKLMRLKLSELQFLCKKNNIDLCDDTGKKYKKEILTNALIHIN